MIRFEITVSTIEKPERCTVSEAYSGKRCPERGTIELDVVAVHDNERGREHYRTFRHCPADAALFTTGFVDSGSPVELIIV